MNFFVRMIIFVFGVAVLSTEGVSQALSPETLISDNADLNGGRRERFRPGLRQAFFGLVRRLAELPKNKINTDCLRQDAWFITFRLVEILRFMGDRPAPDSCENDAIQNPNCTARCAPSASCYCVASGDHKPKFAG